MIREGVIGGFVDELADFATRWNDEVNLIVDGAVKATNRDDFLVVGVIPDELTPSSGLIPILVGVENVVFVDFGLATALFVMLGTNSNPLLVNVLGKYVLTQINLNTKGGILKE